MIRSATTVTRLSNGIKRAGVGSHGGMVPKDDPIYLAPSDPNHFGSKTRGSSDVYYPFKQFLSGGFTPASLAGFFITFLAGETLGNP